MNIENTIIIDNYDSFTYNLVQIIEQIIGKVPMVKRNDEINADQLESYDYIFLSPGPGIPEESGNLIPIIQENYQRKKIFGVCLGLQAIGQVLGCRLMNLGTVYHGMQTNIVRTENDCPIYTNIDQHFDAGRYHSWVIDPDTVTDELIITSYDDQGQIMSARHKEHAVYGVQYHPESILTPIGKQLIENFFNYG